MSFTQLGSETWQSEPASVGSGLGRVRTSGSRVFNSVVTDRRDKTKRFKGSLLDKEDCELDYISRFFTVSVCRSVCVCVCACLPSLPA